VIGLRRGTKALEGSFLEERLRAGDILLVIGSWRAIRALEGQPRDFLLLNLQAEIDQVAPALSQAPYALLSLGIMVFLMVTGIVPNVIAALVGYLMMGLFRCIDMDGAYRSISWKILLLIVGVMPFAVALERTGGVDLAVNGLLHLLGEASPHVLLASLFVLTAAIGLFISNTATAVLMAPIGDEHRRSPRRLALSLCNDGCVGLLCGVHDVDIVTRQHPGSGTGSIPFRRLCEARRALHGLGAIGNRADGSLAVSVALTLRLVTGQAPLPQTTVMRSWR
jgi:hypothetical protein